MRLILASLALAGAAIPTMAAANVVQQDERGFRVMHIVESDASPAEVWRTIAQPSAWWNPSHSFAGKAENLSLELVPGGCFCEIADSLSVEHARVIYSEPGVRLRLRGSLGPLQQDAVTGILTFALKERADGGTVISVEYSVGGNFRTAVGSIAPAVDGVITEQANRLAKAALTPPAARAPDPAVEAPVTDEAIEAAEPVPEDAVDEVAGDDAFGDTFADTPEPQR